MTRRGDTLLFDAPPTVAAWAAAGGKKESEGPLASAFDFVTQDAAFGEQGCENWEQAESLLQRKAVELCLRKADIPRSKVDLAFAGDLQAQCTASNYTMRELGIPFAGATARARPWRRRWALPRCLRRRHGRAGPGADKQPFLRGRAAIPHAAGVRCQAHPHGPSGRPPPRGPAWCGRTAARACRCCR